MANRFRDVKTVSVHSKSWTGVQDITVDVDGTPFDYSADDNEHVARVDVTKRVIKISISVIDPSYGRDISDAMFGDISLNECLKATVSEKCSEILDSADEDSWIVYCGVTARVLEASIDLRDINQILDDADFFVGAKGDLVFKALHGDADSGLAGAGYEEFTAEDMVITGISSGLKHGDLHSGTLKFRGGEGALCKIGLATSGSGANVFDVHAGGSGTVSFVAPSADGGADETVTIINAVCTGVDITVNHGGRLERKFTFTAYSADGSTSPLS